MSDTLEMRRNALLSELASINMQIHTQKEMDTAKKRVKDTTLAVEESKRLLGVSYAKCQEAAKHLRTCEQELDAARIHVRKSIKQKKKAIVSLRRLGGEQREGPYNPPTPLNLRVDSNPSLPREIYTPESQWDIVLGEQLEDSIAAENEEHDEHEEHEEYDEQDTYYTRNTWYDGDGPHYE